MRRRFRPLMDRLETRANPDTAMPLPIGPPDVPPPDEPPGADILRGIEPPSLIDQFREDLADILNQLGEALYPDRMPPEDLTPIDIFRGSRTTPDAPPQDMPSRTDFLGPKAVQPDE